MSTDKRKPIPSPKHTLDDVLKTLQDLVRNELADEDVGRGRPPRTAAQTRDEFEDDARMASPAFSAQPLKPSLDTAAAHTTVAAQADTDVAFTAAPLSAHPAGGAAGLNESEASDRGADTQWENASSADDADAAQRTDLGTELSTLFADDAAGESANTTDRRDRENATDDGAPEGAADATQTGPEQTSINWDDIPVLNEVVDLPTQSAPAAPNARTVAVRVVARLNIELRKAGTAPLDPAIIDRLEQLLREALDPNAAATDQ